MSIKPTTYPEWGEVDQNDGVTGAPNKVEPTASFKQTGVNRDEPLLRAYLNYDLDLIDAWVKYFDTSRLSGTETLAGGAVSVTIADQGNTTYNVTATPDANVGSVWVVKDSSTQFTINTSAGAAEGVDWILTNIT